MNDLGLAISIVATAFEDKCDKGGQPYVLHCLHVMNQMPEDDEELRIIAVLHDLIEDTRWTLQDLRDHGFSDRVVWGVQVLTHDPEEEYMKYIERISFTDDARLVKTADLRHNADIMRMKGLRKKDFDRLQKYFTAYEYLKTS
jgi:(p)ppGpp synthase/HD superfamily hydrolase